MTINFNLPKFSYNLPWFMFDIDNKQLITSPTIPSEIRDQKDVILAETPIVGQNYDSIIYGGGGNRKISFTIPIMKRNNSVGNVLLLKQFDNLRNRSVGLTNIFSSQFTPNPKVLYYWGTGSVPLIYWVKKCDFSHQEYWTNELGNPQYTMVDIELWLDETSPLYKAEEIYRKFASLAGMVTGTLDTIQSQRLNQRVF